MPSDFISLLSADLDINSPKSLYSKESVYDLLPKELQLPSSNECNPVTMSQKSGGEASPPPLAPLAADATSTSSVSMGGPRSSFTASSSPTMRSSTSVTDHAALQVDSCTPSEGVSSQGMTEVLCVETLTGGGCSGGGGGSGGGAQQHQTTPSKRRTILNISPPPEDLLDTSRMSCQDDSCPDSELSNSIWMEDSASNFSIMSSSSYNDNTEVPRKSRKRTPRQRPGPKPITVDGASLDVFDADSAKGPHFVLSQLGSDSKTCSKGGPVEGSQSLAQKAVTLSGQYPSKSEGKELKIVVQPETQHRARYLTEGSRGSVKDRTQQGFPTVKLEGISETVVLQIFVGSDSGRVKPHGFYQACRVTGRNTTPCKEIDIEGTTVIEVCLEPANNMTLAVDCVGILKLRNADVEARIGVAGSKKKSTRARLVFRVSISRPDGSILTLQTPSSPILCTQPAGAPEILKKSLHSCSVMGGEEVFLIGKNFLKGTKVIFQENVSDDNSWKGEAEIDMELFHQNHLIVKVPPYHNPKISSPVCVGIYVVTNAGRSHEVQPFTYTPEPANTVEVNVKKEVPSHAQSCSFEESAKGMKTPSCTLDKVSLLPSALMTPLLPLVKNEEVTPMEVSSNQTAPNVFKTSDVIGSAQQTLDMSLNMSLSSIPFSNSVPHQLVEPEQHQVQSTSFSSAEPLSTIQKQDIAPTSPLLQQVTQQYQRPDLLLDHRDALSQERLPNGERVMEMQQLGKTPQQSIDQQTMQQQQQQHTMQQQQQQQHTMQQQQQQQHTMQQQQQQQHTMQQQQQHTMQQQQHTMQQQQQQQQHTMQQQSIHQQQHTMQQQQQTLQQQQSIHQQQQQTMQQQSLQQLSSNLFPADGVEQLERAVRQLQAGFSRGSEASLVQQVLEVAVQQQQQQQQLNSVLFSPSSGPGSMQQQAQENMNNIFQQINSSSMFPSPDSTKNLENTGMQTSEGTLASQQQQQALENLSLQQQLQSDLFPSQVQEAMTGQIPMQCGLFQGGSRNENPQQQLSPQGLFQSQSTGAPSEDGGSRPKQMQTSVFQNMVQTQGQVGALFQTSESMLHSGSQQQGSLFQQAEEMLSIQVSSFLQQPSSHPSSPQLFHSQSPMNDAQDPPTTLFQNQKHSPTQEQVQAAMFQSSLTVLTNSPLQPDQQQHGSGLFLSQNNVTTLQSGQIAQDSKQQQQQLSFLTSLQSSGSPEQQSVSVFQPGDKSSHLQESTPMDQQPQQDAVYQTMSSSADGLSPSQQGAFFQSQQSMVSPQEQQQQAGLLLFSGRNQMQQLNSSLPSLEPQNQAMFLTQSNLMSVSPQEQPQPMSFQNQSSVAGGTPQNEQPQEALFHDPQQMQLVQGSSSASESPVTIFMPQASLPALQGSMSQQKLPQATIFSTQTDSPSSVQPQGALFHTTVTRTMNQPGQPQQTSGLFLFGIQNADCSQLITSGASTLSDQLIAISQSGQNQREKEDSIQSLLTQTISEPGTVPNAMTASQNMEKIDDLLVSLQDQSNITHSF
ncbi:nuclear factor of activated T-cells 5-like isoform X2 [Polyodon spathula]|uniref:nuclear factor of activated T-cells 5-like isoform X2 n=1 Tax=Polyodon spathula TaxID=7913 RepID=UPI001B7E6240|nr:nuclear factor of activated T-cells 5-like isoform X2 [Polyodon spathula]